MKRNNIKRHKKSWNIDNEFNSENILWNKKSCAEKEMKLWIDK
jgi:hypothetical protein